MWIVVILFWYNLKVLLCVLKELIYWIWPKKKKNNIYTQYPVGKKIHWMYFIKKCGNERTTVRNQEWSKTSLTPKIQNKILKPTTTTKFPLRHPNRYIILNKTKIQKEKNPKNHTNYLYTLEILWATFKTINIFLYRIACIFACLSCYSIRPLNWTGWFCVMLFWLCL